MSRDLTALKTNRESLRRGSGEHLHHRAHALEEVFFAKREHELVEALREKLHREERLAELSRQCGIDDPEIVGALLDCGIRAETLPALMLTPLVEIAWADGEMEPHERAVLVEEALRHRMAPDSASWRLLQSWLAERPPRMLFEAWAGYVKELVGSVPPAGRRAFSRGILEMAREVAERFRARRRFNLDERISEQRVLDRVERALDLPWAAENEGTRDGRI